MPIKSINLWFSLVFLLIFALNIVVLIMDLTTWYWYTKPMIILSLLGFFLLRNSFRHIIILGMITALLGDIFLLFDGDLFFILGLGSFLITQIIYAKAFLDQRSSLKITGSIALVMGVASIYAIGIFLIILPNLGALQVPVVIYILSILAMFATSLVRVQSLMQSYWMVIFGAICFLASDSLLALDLFTDYFENASVGVMSTYMIAQYFIITGYDLSLADS